MSPDLIKAIDTLTEGSGPNKVALTVVISELLVMADKFVQAQTKTADALTQIAKIYEVKKHS